uniref:Copia protein n=1 Tax=Tanacetum cinerariifolium TaxID=118510 RepID=A0A6L2NST5_TANCI|nr:copia protein [Tanacetum cinerariifolium]
MGSMGELTFFLGLQVKQKEDGIFISQDKYFSEIMKKFDFLSVKTASTPIETKKPLVKDEEADNVDVNLYRSMIDSLLYLTSFRPDIMYAICACSMFQVTPKTSHLQDVKRIFRRHISWQCKKQTIVAASTTEAEYVNVASYYEQVLWIQNQMLDYGFNFMNTKIYIDNESIICIVENPVFHSKTKHIEIRHHFTKDAYEKKLIQKLCTGGTKVHTARFGLCCSTMFQNGYVSYIGKEDAIWIGKIIPLFPSMLTQAVVEEGEDSETPTESQPTPSTTQPSVGDQPPLIESSLEHDTSQELRVNLESTSRSRGDQVKLPHDSPLSGGHTSDRAEGSLNLEELSTLCTNLSNKVLALETVKDAQAKEILTLKARIKKLEKRCKPSISHHRAWLKSVAKLSKMKKLAVDEGRTSNKTEELNLDANTEVIAKDKGNGEKGESTISTARPKRVSTAGVTISTADPEVSVVECKIPFTTTNIFDDEDITMAQTLIKMKEEKAKEKGVALKEVEESDRPARSVLTLKLLTTINHKDKGKAILEEPKPKKMTRSDFDDAQVARDEEIARQLEAELHEEEKYTVDERAKLLAEYFERRKKQLVEERAAAIRNKPPTRTQLRRLMMTYLKHTGSFTYSQLNKRTFKEIQALYIKEQEKVTNFVPVGSDEDERLIQKIMKRKLMYIRRRFLKNLTVLSIEDESKKEGRKAIHADDESSDKGVDSSKKGKACPRMKRMSKRKKTNANLKEEEYLKTFLKIASDEEEVVDYKVLEKTMFEADAEDELWQNQEEWSLKSWNFYENCRVHILILEYGTEIHMLAERRLMNLEAMIEERMIFKCWFYHHTTNGHQFTMSNRHQELASPEANGFCKELASPKQAAHGKDISNSLIVDSLLKTIWLSVHHVIAMMLFQSKRLLLKKHQIRLWLKCLSDESLIILIKELQLDDKLNFVEEPVEIMDREIKKLRQSRITIVKVRWNSKRGPEFIWEREDEIRAKYPHLFSNITSSSN